MTAAITPPVIVTSPGDKRLARAAWSDAGFEQCAPFESEPIFVVIPKNSTEEAMLKLSRRFGVSVDAKVRKRAEPWRAEDSENEALVRQCNLREKHHVCKQSLASQLGATHALMKRSVPPSANSTLESAPSAGISKR